MILSVAKSKVTIGDKRYLRLLSEVMFFK